MHLTKRFGIVAASQLPLHYLLAMKSPYSPLQLLLQTSHETLNSVHQVIGRVILMLLVLHATLYLNFFIRMGVLTKRIQNLDVIMGLSSITLLSVLGASASGVFRRMNYRVFYLIHVTVSSLVPLLLFFHVKHVRSYIIQCGVIQLANMILRYIHTKPVSAKLKGVPETSLTAMRA